MAATLSEGFVSYDNFRKRQEEEEARRSIVEQFQAPEKMVLDDENAPEGFQVLRNKTTFENFSDSFGEVVSQGVDSLRGFFQQGGEAIRKAEEQRVGGDLLKGDNFEKAKKGIAKLSEGFRLAEEQKVGGDIAKAIEGSDKFKDITENFGEKMEKVLLDYSKYLEFQQKLDEKSDLSFGKNFLNNLTFGATREIFKDIPDEDAIAAFGGNLAAEAVFWTVGFELAAPLIKSAKLAYGPVGKFIAQMASVESLGLGKQSLTSLIETGELPSAEEVKQHATELALIDSGVQGVGAAAEFIMAMRSIAQAEGISTWQAYKNLAEAVKNFGTGKFGKLDPRGKMEVMKDILEKPPAQIEAPAIDITPEAPKVPSEPPRVPSEPLKVPSEDIKVPTEQIVTPIEVESIKDLVKPVEAVTPAESVRPKITPAEMKEQKRFLLSEVNTALSDLKSGKELGEKVEIHVPGDGDFTINNTEKALLAFQKGVKAKFPGASLKPISTKGKQPPKLRGRIDFDEVEYYNTFEPRKQKLEARKGKEVTVDSENGFWTDGSVMIKTDVKPEGAKERSISTLLEGGKDSNPATLEAEFFSQKAGTSEPMVHVQSSEGPGFYSARNVDMILSIHPKALPSINKGILYFKDSKDKVVGATAPFTDVNGKLKAFPEEFKRPESKAALQPEISPGGKAPLKPKPKAAKDQEIKSLEEVNAEQRKELKELERSGAFPSEIKTLRDAIEGREQIIKELVQKLNKPKSAKPKVKPKETGKVVDSFRLEKGDISKAESVIKILESGRIRSPFTIEGKLYTSTGNNFEGGKISSVNAYELIRAESFKGPTHSHKDIPTLRSEGKLEKGSFTGTEVKFGKTNYVLGEKTSFISSKQDVKLGDTLSAKKSTRPLPGTEPLPPETESISKEVPTKIREIIKMFSEEFDVPIRIGKFRQRALGIFKPFESVIRLKTANDLETAVHEVGHKLHFKLWGTARSINAALRPFESELKPLGKYEPFLMEGFAEFTRLYVTNPDIALKHSPKFFKFFEKTMNDVHPELLKILKLAREQYKVWRETSSFERMKSNIEIESEKSFLLKTKEYFNRIQPSIVGMQEKWLDDLYFLKKMTADIAGISVHEVENWKSPHNIYVAARVYRGVAGKVEAFLEHEIFDPLTLKKVEGKSLAEVLNAIKTNDDLINFMVYTVAKRTVELEGRGIKSGFDLADAEKNVRDLEFRNEDIAKDFYAFKDDVVGYLVKSGRFAPESAAKMKALNQFHVPFYRLFEEGEKAIQEEGFFKQGFESGESFFKIKGSGRSILNPIESTIKDVYTMISAAERNLLGQKLIALAHSTKGMGKYVEKLPVPIKLAAKVNQDEIFDRVEKMKAFLPEEDQIALDNIRDLLPEVFNIFRPSVYGNRENVITVYFKGKPSFYEVHPDLYRVWTGNLDRQTLHPIMNGLRAITRFKRHAIVSNPKFIANNFIRDTMERLALTRHDSLSLVESVGAFASAAKQDALYVEFLKSGAGMSSFTAISRGFARKKVDQLIGKKNYASMLNPLNITQTASKISEELNRLAEFTAALRVEEDTRAGLEMAAFAARDVSIDFAKGGTYARSVNSIYAFFNAHLQGLEKLYRSAKNPEQRGRALKNIMMKLVPISAIFAMLNHDDEVINDIPDVERDMNFIVRLPYTGEVLKLPAPFDLGRIVNGFTRRFVEFSMNKNPKAFDGYLGSMLEGMIPSILPDGLEPWVEKWANEDFFFKTPIVPGHMKGALPADQYTPFTSESAKLLGKFIGLLPNMKDYSSGIVVEHFIHSWGGGLGNMALSVSDRLLEQIGIKPQHIKPYQSLGEEFRLTFIKRAGSRTKSVNRFYELADDANQIEKSIHLARERGDVDRQRELSKMEGGIDLHTVYKNMAKMQSLIANIRINPKMSGEEKRDQIDAVQIQIIEYARYLVPKIEKSIAAKKKFVSK